MAAATTRRVTDLAITTSIDDEYGTVQVLNADGDPITTANAGDQVTIKTTIFEYEDPESEIAENREYDAHYYVLNYGASGAQPTRMVADQTRTTARNGYYTFTMPAANVQANIVLSPGLNITTFAEDASNFEATINGIEPAEENAYANADYAIGGDSVTVVLTPYEGESVSDFLLGASELYTESSDSERLSITFTQAADGTDVVMGKKATLAVTPPTGVSSEDIQVFWDAAGTCQAGGSVEGFDVIGGGFGVVRLTGGSELDGLAVTVTGTAGQSDEPWEGELSDTGKGYYECIFSMPASGGAAAMTFGA